jgi:hypothetical protein
LRQQAHALRPQLIPPHQVEDEPLQQAPAQPSQPQKQKQQKKPNKQRQQHAQAKRAPQQRQQSNEVAPEEPRVLELAAATLQGLYMPPGLEGDGAAGVVRSSSNASSVKSWGALVPELGSPAYVTPTPVPLALNSAFFDKLQPQAALPPGPLPAAPARSTVLGGSSIEGIGSSFGNVVDQEDGMLRIRDYDWAYRFPRAGEPAVVSPLNKPMRAVRTSDSTLCTLSDDCSV